MFTLQNYKVLITSGTKGIGKATVHSILKFENIKQTSL